MKGPTRKSRIFFVTTPERASTWSPVSPARGRAHRAVRDPLGGAVAGALREKDPLRRRDPGIPRPLVNRTIVPPASYHLRDPLAL
jgi:hypothetical protein